jgi:uncharacterized protein YndB with AHSA1/START domain
MEKYKKSTFIEAPPAKIFDYLTDATHFTEIWPSMVEVSNAQARPDGAVEFDWVYKMAGLKFHGHSETLEVQRDRVRLMRNDGGIPSTFRWSFEQHDKGTDFSLEVEYEIPKTLLARLATPLLRRLNERDGDTLVHNLKERMEMGELVT